MPDEEQINESSEPAQEQPREPETMVIPKAQWEAMVRERDESRLSERYWAGVARGHQPQAQPQRVAEEPEERLDPAPFLKGRPTVEGDTPEKFVDEVTSKGVSAIKARGFATVDDVVDISERVAKETVARERTKISTDARYMAEFPEMRDENSELFKETQKRYQRTIEFDPGALKTPGALYADTQAAKDYLEAKAARSAPARRGEQDMEDEQDRRMRARAQDNRPRGREAAPDDEGDDDYIGPEARQVIKAMKITEKQFLASRKLTQGLRAGVHRGR